MLGGPNGKRCNTNSYGDTPAENCSLAKCLTEFEEFSTTLGLRVDNSPDTSLCLCSAGRFRHLKSVF